MNVNKEVHTTDETAENKLSDRLLTELKNIVDSYHIYQNSLAKDLDKIPTCTQHLSEMKISQIGHDI